jgi:hypothetical protein
MGDDKEQHRHAPRQSLLSPAREGLPRMPPGRRASLMFVTSSRSTRSHRAAGATTRRRRPWPSRPTGRHPETIVWRWVEAFNARDLDHMIRCLDSDVRFHPLRLAGLSSSYRGHNGVRRWFGELVRLRHEHRIVLDELGVIPDGEVLAVGALALAEEPDIEIGPFHALHRLNGNLIVAAHHCITSLDLIEHLGLIP